MKEKKIQIDIKQINDPNIVKSIPYKQLGNFSNEIRRYIIQSVSKNGGHLASNLGTVDATISLCRCFDFSKDKKISGKLTKGGQNLPNSGIVYLQPDNTVKTIKEKNWVRRETVYKKGLST